MSHPLVIVELAYGTPPEPRRRTLDDVGLLQGCHWPITALDVT